MTSTPISEVSHIAPAGCTVPTSGEPVPGTQAVECARRPVARELTCAFSIFHEPWWLDITAPGYWRTARCVRGGRVLGEMPYLDTRLGFWRVSGLPMFTRTLGPVVIPEGATLVEQARNRFSVIEEMIDQLPNFHRFYQNLDPRIEDALAFQIRGFDLKQSYTYRIHPKVSASDVWRGMRSRTRNAIRSATSHVRVEIIDEPAEFIEFYNKSQEERQRGNMYSPEAMTRLAETFVSRRTGKLLGAYTPEGELVAAVGLVWDRHSMYYLLSSRSRQAHSGSVSLLVWAGIQDALMRGIVFDFDGIANVGVQRFLSGFGGELVPRIGIERLRPGYSVVRQIRDLSVMARQSVRKSIASC